MKSYGPVSKLLTRLHRIGINPLK